MQKLCDGLGIPILAFFNDDWFKDIEPEVEMTVPQRFSAVLSFLYFRFSEFHHIFIFGLFSPPLPRAKSTI